MKNCLFLALASVLLLASCGKEDLSETIVGTWDLHNLNVTCPPDVTDIETGDFPATNGCIAIDDFDDPCVRLVFSENGLVQLFSGDSISDLDTDDPVSYTVDEDNDIVRICVELEDCTDFRYNGDDLTVSFPEDGCTLLYTFRK